MLIDGQIPVAARSKVWVYGLFLAGIAGSNSARDMDVCVSLVSAVRCQVKVSAMGQSLVQGSSTKYGVWNCVW